MFHALAGLSFIQLQIIQAWAKCSRQWKMQANYINLFCKYPSLTSEWHQKALWMASIGSIGLFISSLGLTVLACVQTQQQAQIATVRIVI